MLRRQIIVRCCVAWVAAATILNLFDVASARADPVDVRLMSDAIIQETPVQERILKWREPIRIVVYHEEPSNYPNKPIAGLTEGRAFDIVGKLKEAIKREIFYRSQAFNSSLDYAVDLNANTIDIYLIDRQNFGTLEQAFAATQSDRSNSIVPLLQYAISVGPRPDSSCIFTVVFDSESYIVKSVGVIDLGVNDAGILQCFSRILLFSLGFGDVLPGGTHSVTAQPNDIMEPTSFDYDVVRILYSDGLLPGLVESDADRTVVEETVAEILHNESLE